MIELRGAGKRYRKLEEPATLIRALLPHRALAKEEVWALKDLSFTVAQGETVGILGRNGAGKTTLLRLLAGVTQPTTGNVRVGGRIAPLIGLGVGFHEEMSGRENVLVNGMLLGLTAEQVHARFDQIVEFAELEDFLETPVKFYSSGMFMRLAFAVAAHIDPTVVLLDEVLAVGDARFQLKCFDRLRDLQEQGAAILLISHSMLTIRQVCERAIVLQDGRLEYDGSVEGAIDRHERGAIDPSLRAETTESVTFVSSAFSGSTADEHRVAYDEEVELDVTLRFAGRVQDPVLTVGAMTADGLFVGFNSTPPGRSWRTLEAGEVAQARMVFRARLGGGRYRLVMDVKSREAGQILARNDDLMLTVEGRTGSSGIADVGVEVDFGERVPAQASPGGPSPT